MYTTEDGKLFDDTTALGRALWQKSSKIEGYNNSPVMVSIMLYRRLWSHHRAFALLYNAHLNTDADNALRNSIEAAICIAANFRQPDGLWHQLKLDAVKTLVGQINIFKDFGWKDLERDAEAQRRDLVKGLPEGQKGEQLRMDTLATAGEVPDLYRWYHQLSSTSTHVSGLSILRNVVPGGTPDVPDPITSLTRRAHPFWQIGCTIIASRMHSALIEDWASMGLAIELATRLDERSAELWGGDEA